MDELQINQVDFSRFNNLHEFYYEAVRSFSYMMSRNIPEFYELKGGGNSEVDNEVYSSKEGIAALEKCANMLRCQRAGEEVDDSYKQLKTLGDWYTEALVSFTHDVLSLAPVELYIDEDNKIDNAIEVFEKCANDLKETIEPTH